MLVKFKPYLICDTLVNNCPRRALAVFTCHQGLGGGGGVLQGVARKVAATATPFLIQFLLILIKTKHKLEMKLAMKLLLLLWLPS